MSPTYFGRHLHTVAAATSCHTALDRGIAAIAATLYHFAAPATPSSFFAGLLSFFTPVL